MDEAVFKSRLTPEMIELLVDILQNTNEPFLELNEIFELINNHHKEKIMENLGIEFQKNQSLDTLSQIGKIKKETTKFKGVDKNDK